MPKKTAKEDVQGKTTRKRIPLTHRWNPDLIDALERFANAQTVAPSEIAVMEKALEEFLQKHGFWPPE